MTLDKNVPVITLDGPSGTGKGTVSQMLAKHLGWHYLDSGSLYRVLAYAAQEKSVDLTDVEQLVQIANALNLRFEPDSERNCRIYLEGQDVTAKLRSESCGQNASKIAAMPEIRSALLERQRNFAKPPGLVTDGRDMGTVVFPDASLKIYLYASAEERAQRRFLQLKEIENDVRLAQVIDELAKRDERDKTREYAPLKPAPDAIEIDTTRLTIAQVFNKVLQLTNEYLSELLSTGGR